MRAILLLALMALTASAQPIEVDNVCSRRSLIFVTGLSSAPLRRLYFSPSTRDRSGRQESSADRTHLNFLQALERRMTSFSSSPFPPARSVHQKFI